MKAFGTRPTYQIFAAVTLITGIMYFFFNALYLRKRPQVEGNDIVKKKPKVKPGDKSEESSIGGDPGSKQAIEMEPGVKLSTEVYANEKISYDAENEAFKTNDIATESKSPKPDRDAREIEAIKNARNLDRIEKIDDDDDDNDRKKTKIKSRNVKDSGNDDGVDSKPTIVKNGSHNLAYEGEENENGKCNATIEKRPEESN